MHFFNISTSKSGLRMVCFVHIDLEMCFAPNGVHFFNISTSKNPTLRCFCTFSSLIWAPAALASLLFDHPEPQIIGKTWKNTVNRDFSTFSHLHLLSPDSFSSLIFSLLLFSSLTLPTSAFPSVHTVGSLTSKLPSMTIHWNWGLPYFQTNLDGI